jgi:hypothetical protein
MGLTIDPEPDADQREAVELALAELLPGGEATGACRSAWWRAGVAESLEDGTLDDASG